jgi:hypothetical protein
MSNVAFTIFEIKVSISSVSTFANTSLLLTILGSLLGDTPSFLNSEYALFRGVCTLSDDLLCRYRVYDVHLVYGHRHLLLWNYFSLVSWESLISFRDGFICSLLISAFTLQSVNFSVTFCNLSANPFSGALLRVLTRKSYNEWWCNLW